jgi:hypothetical protein
VFLDKRSSGPLAQLVEQLTFNQWVTGSNPVRLTTDINDLAVFGSFLTSLKSVLVALWWHKTGDYSFQILL